MNNLNEIVKLYREDARMQRVIGLLQDVPAARVLLTGTLGAMEPLLVRCMHTLQEGWHQVVVLQTKEEAAYFENDLRSMLPEGEGGSEGVVALLPDSFKRAGVFEEVNTGNILLRTEVANKLIRKQGRGIVVVTYPEALFEQIVAPEQLSKTRIEISVGERLDVDFLIEVLISYHFERTDFVYKPGQFSIRGGIVDVFSYGNMLPYRVELFDDEVERICTFDVEDQLSKTRIRSVSILPNIQAHFRREEKRPLLDIMNRTTLVWCYDVQGVLDKLQYCMDKVAVVMEQEELMEVEELRALFAERAFVLPEQWMHLMEARAIIEFGKVSYFGERATQVHFDCKPQPSFNKHFDLLIRNFHENTSAGMVNYLFSDNPRQLERFEHIFNDLKAGVTYCPVSIALHSGFIDYDLNIACYTDHQIFERYHKYNIRSGYNKADSLSLRMLRELQPGDYVTHIDHGVGVFSGLEKLNINGQIQETVRLIYRDKDLLYVGINSLHKISKYIGKEGEMPKLNKIGSDAWDNLKRRTKSKIKDIAQELIKLYAKRRAATGFTFPPDTYLQNELEASFIYEDTPDQYKATNDVKLDMEKAYPMDRLICGDVGFGKTEVAIRAAFKAVVSGKQVAVLVPTTILALQHYRTFGERLKEFGVSIDYINRFKSTKQKNDIFERVKTGKLEILIGTHAILNQKINFQDLGLLIVDEEQKFGVAAKEKLRAMRVNVDTLTLTATPIPRTLQFSLMSARDLSIINTPPPNRQPIHTEVRTFNEELIRDAVYFEYYRAGQIFFLHNRVSDLPEVTAMLRRMCPELKITSAHGQMEADKLEETLIDFIDGKYDMLVSTNIIETGLDIPNANTIIINNAHHFGLSDLHQLRGRVGRSNKKAFCYLFCPPLSVLTPEARKRLQTIEQFSDLGSGFQIAMRDLDIRGAGNLLGGEQSGFIADIGFDTYQKILDETIQELKETDFKDVFQNDINQPKFQFIREVDIETDVEMRIPDHYVTSTQERISLYSELDSLTNEQQIAQFTDRLTDRFGPLPKQILELFNALRLRWLCKSLGFERLILKNHKLRCLFLANPASPYFESPKFNAILQYIHQKGSRNLALKQTNKLLALHHDDVKTLQVAHKILQEMDTATTP